MKLHLDTKREILARVFGVEKLEPDITDAIFGDSKGSVVIDVVWIAHIFGYWTLPITISRVQYADFFGARNIGYAAILVNDEFGKFGSSGFVNQEPMKAVEVTDLQDAVALSLECMNLIEKPNPGFDQDGDFAGVSVSVEILQVHGSRLISEMGYFDSPDPSWRELKKALVATVYGIAERYGDTNVTEFLANNRVRLTERRQI